METGQFDSLMETLGREALGQIQLRKLQLMLDTVLVSNKFYRKKLGSAGVTKSAQLRTFDDFYKLPFTTKKELSADQADHPPDGSNLPIPRAPLRRRHRNT